MEDTSIAISSHAITCLDLFYQVNSKKIDEIKHFYALSPTVIESSPTLNIPYFPFYSGEAIFKYTLVWA